MAIVSKDHFYRIQTSSEIPVNGDLLNVPVELCHQMTIIDTGTGEVWGTKPGEGILNLGTPNELEVEFPGLTEKMEWVKIALITKAMRMIVERKAVSQSVPVEAPPTPPPA